MKTAIIKSKNYATGAIETEGKAMILACMDHQGNRGFYEIRFLNNPAITNCRWVEDSEIKNEEVS